ncbi:glycolate oxidase FAD binding subunit [Azotobacter vinelandii CA]|uniref:Glycolate oxidase FAD binding subunit, glcE n=2 Tax=Azotobacter vinelandii TaxID=354 RepID=C1DFQ7_AZOVD|nr:glycolate oxidase subunit GlcE [Azotobacter vinelandii]ACO80453.1 glycolate oxidase FAD binding subunit, glcE [Azotobacter vinelandii DJ]AGK13555.1 glycolate oxidase FAD binding subunit [Azotobacter vinelandii CA]AGK17996.1 glycolate oxidase FAD binding subunit [Azotobacter vinelandii CA6]SFX34740.1 glycolate oxidase FAD binding subunit [Azotobacter vinelandii]GLK60321.1 glycolate oxidase subunit GlcE [Azotobacter vinelandii]
MRHDHDDSAALLEQVNHAFAQGVSLRIQGSNSKARLGRPVRGTLLDTRRHRGIVNYDPTELVLSARAGTPLDEIEAVLDAAGQMLPCEPPHLGDGATLGGMVAAGLSGPRRPWAGSVRDYVLGTRLITGRGKHLRFGGEVMKNVAGYDLSRLLAGSFGCLGLITEVSLKVLPKPRQCVSLSLEMDIGQALARLAEWGKQPLPISAASHDGQALRLRLEGGEGSVRSARQRLGGEEIDSRYWLELREQRLPFFAAGTPPLWRLSLPTDTGPLALPGSQLIDWGGAQRWLKSDADAELIRGVVAEAGGHATRYGEGEEPFQPLSAHLLRYHQNLKKQLDPRGIFNPGRMYAEV